MDHVAQIRTLAPGEILFSAGDLGEEGYVVLDGSVAIASTDGKALANLGQGELFGEMAIIDSGPRSATASAGQHGAKVAAINAAQLIFFITSQPAFALFVIERLTQRMRGLLPPTAAASVAMPVERSSEGKPWSAAETLHEMAPGFHHFTAFQHSANPCVLKGPDRTILIDTCLPQHQQNLLAQLRVIGLQPEDVDTIVLTHEHIDHVGGLALFPKAEIHAHRLAASKLAVSDENALMNRSFGARLEPIRIANWLDDGQIISNGLHALEVIYTPGHTTGHVSFRVTSPGSTGDILVAGDCVIGGGHLGGVFGTGNLADYVQTLEHLASRHFSMMVTGHGAPSVAPQQDIALALKRCRSLLTDTLQITAAPQDSGAYERIIRNARALNRLYRNA